MRAVMMTHVNEFGGAFHTLKGGFDNVVRFSDKGDYGAVGSLSGVDVEKLHFGRILYGIGNTFYNGHVAPFAEIGHAFDDLFHGKIW